jgi:hypothetical protein
MPVLSHLNGEVGSSQLRKPPWADWSYEVGEGVEVVPSLVQGNGILFMYGLTQMNSKESEAGYREAAGLGCVLQDKAVSSTWLLLVPDMA